MAIVDALSDAGCGNCAALQGTYVLDFIGDTLPDNPCLWRITFPRTCTVDTLDLFITGPVGNCRFQLQFNDSTLVNPIGIGPWQAFAASFDDCISERVLTAAAGGTPQCSALGTTATIIPVLA